MSLLQRLYDLRIQIGHKRQPSRRAAVETFDRELRSLPVAHPFDLDDQSYATLSRVSGFVASNNGHVGRPRAKFLYRVSGVGNLVEFADWQPRTRYLPKWEIHAQLLRETGNAAWKPLSDYCSGTVAGRRAFSWWSTLDLYAEDHCLAASRAGIPNDRVPLYAVVLRLRLKEVGTTNPPRVPTVADAWDMPIFDPMPEEPAPSSGYTISLENPEKLARGCDEYVLGPVPASLIEFIAVPERAGPCGMRSGDELWERLMEYHS